MKLLSILLTMCFAWLFSPLIPDKEKTVFNEILSLWSVVVGFGAQVLYPKVSWHRQGAKNNKGIAQSNRYHRNIAVPWRTASA